MLSGFGDKPSCIQILIWPLTYWLWDISLIVPPPWDSFPGMQLHHQDHMAFVRIKRNTDVEYLAVGRQMLVSFPLYEKNNISEG